MDRPARIFFGSSPGFAFNKSSSLTPYFRAIEAAVSPGWTTCVRAVVAAERVFVAPTGRGAGFEISCGGALEIARVTGMTGVCGGFVAGAGFGKVAK